MAKNIFQRQIAIPDKPKILSEERVFVYLPSAGPNQKGIAQFKSKDFVAINGDVKLRWPMDLVVSGSDPLTKPSLVKVLSSEFKHTNNPVKLIHPVTGVEYESALSEIKLDRENRDPHARPELVMLSSDFEGYPVTGPNNEQYVAHKIKRQNPLTTPTIIQVDNQDFVRASDIVKISWPMAHNPALGSNRTSGFGLVKINPGLGSSLKYSSDNSLQVDLEAIKTNLANHLATKPTYGESNPTNWPNRSLFVDPVTGLAKRDANGNILLSLTKESVGLSKLENIAFSDRVYNQFGSAMKNHFESQFNSKLNKTVWDGPSGVFRDWAPPSLERNTAQKWFMQLEGMDDSIWASIRTLKYFLGFYTNITELTAIYPADADLLGSRAFLQSTNTYWSIRLNVDVYEWYDTELDLLSFYEFLETDASELKPNAPIGSVGTSGKWAQSDHVHPSDPNKFDTKAMEDAIITVTTTTSTGQDFVVKLAGTKVLNNLGVEIEAAIVDYPEYLGTIIDPQTNDYAIIRSTKQLFVYNGTTWLDTSLTGSIAYDTNRTINIPYVRMAKGLHNWKSSPSEFVEGPNTTEHYWAGSKSEFEGANIAELPAGTLIVVDEEETHLPGHLVTKEQLDDSGLKVSDLEESSNEQFVSVTTLDALFGVPLTVTHEAAVPGVRGPRRKLTPLDFGSDVLNQADTDRMAIIVDGPNGKTIGKKVFSVNRLIASDNDGNLSTTIINPINSVSTAISDESINLQSGKVVIATGPKTITTWSTGNIAKKPITTTSQGGLQVLDLVPNRLVKTDSTGGLDTIPLLEGNLIKSDTGVNQVTLESDKLMVSGSNNTIAPWNSGGVEGAMLVRGATLGSVKLRTHTAGNRIIITGPNGTVSELPAGTLGQLLASGADNAPGWIDAPSAYTNLPQTRLTTNPTELEANSFQGLVAVVLSTPIPEEQMRNNCIYYF